MLAGKDQIARNDAVLQDALRPVDILQIKVERHHALCEAAFDHVPFRTGNDARHEIEGKEPLGAAPVAVYGEGDSLNQIRKIGQLAPLFENVKRHGGQFLVHRGARTAAACRSVTTSSS